MRILLATTLLIGAGLFATAAQASDYKFDVINKGDTAAVEFRTQENGEWSKNWIRDRINSGDKFNMDFNHNDGECEVRTQITFEDGSSFDAGVDYCKVTVLTIFNDHMVAE